MSDDDGRSLIDENGRVFGLVNIVDILVIVLVLAVLIGGIAVVMALGSAPIPTGTDVTNETRYVTLDSGPQPAYVADRVQRGDQLFPHSAVDTLTITDVYRSPHRNESSTIVARARVDGTYNESADVFVYRDEPLRVATTLSLATQTVKLRGTVTAVDESGDTLPTDQTLVTVDARVSTAVAETIQVGDEHRIAGEAIATVESVEIHEIAGSDRQRARLDLDLLTLDRDTGVEFAGRSLRLGAELPFNTNRYQLTGEVVAIHN